MKHGECMQQDGNVNCLRRANKRSKYNQTRIFLFSLLFLQEFSPEIDISIAIEIKQYKIFLSNLSMLCSTPRFRISGDRDSAPDGGVLVENPLEMFQYWPVTAKMVVAMTVTGRDKTEDKFL